MALDEATSCTSRRALARRVVHWRAISVAGTLEASSTVKLLPGPGWQQLGLAFSNHLWFSHWHMDPMTFLALAASFAALFLAGVVVTDACHRRDALLKLEAAHAEAKDTAAKLATIHNGMVEKLQALGDQVAAHEMKLGGAIAKRVGM